MTAINPIHPGEHLAEFLADLGITQYRLAKTIGVPQIRINDIVHCRRSITADTALRIGKALGMTPEFWLNLQRMYDLDVARTTTDVDAIKSLTEEVRHKTFISYHHDDQAEVDEFIKTFDHGRDVFIARAVGSDETMETLVGGDDDDYIMRQIREKYLSDTTVTLVFIGKETWARKFVDWELAASLHQGPVSGKPNGVLAILSPRLTEAILPDRFVDDWQSGCAKLYPYPNSKPQLTQWIDGVFETREEENKRTLITNGRRKLRRNLSASRPGGRASVKPKLDGSHIGSNMQAKPTAIATRSVASASIPHKPSSG